MEVRNIPCQEERKAWREREREREKRATSERASEEEKTRKEREQETDRHATVAGLHTGQPMNLFTTSQGGNH